MSIRCALSEKKDSTVLRVLMRQFLIKKDPMFKIYRFFLVF